MNKIVAFCGSKGSGKSTSATLFRQIMTSEKVEELALAGHLKETCSKVWNLDMNLFLDPNLKEKELDTLIVLSSDDLSQLLREFDVHPNFEAHIRTHLGKICRTPRSLLQYVGTEVLHPIDPLIHVKKMMKKRDPNKISLVTDLRFVSEFNYLSQNFSSEFLPVYVKNSSAEVRAASDSHASERQYLEFASRCVLLNNEGSLEELKQRISSLVEGL